MPNAHDVLFRTLADPTRRAIFERLCREGEKTVGAVTARAGISQPAVSKHLGVLKQAGLVRERHEGRWGLNPTNRPGSAIAWPLTPCAGSTRPHYAVGQDMLKSSVRQSRLDCPKQLSCQGYVAHELSGFLGLRR